MVQGEKTIISNELLEMLGAWYLLKKQRKQRKTGEPMAVCINHSCVAGWWMGWWLQLVGLQGEVVCLFIMETKTWKDLSGDQFQPGLPKFCDMNTTS